ncbi:hypothetical protein [Micromonospora coxensis]|uniref:Rho termination factor, N-terminal domain n=1 Tax=Micromonospora coxensis TaxID=356852 RepID=A0A1C5I7A4_9ACTN|nr:hypothetical protein [Micromonospora coxensis]SCG54063.1 hypothetical protein GA0070614_2325 [Micromonospora coxensis]
MATRSASGRAGGATATKNVPGNQTPNTPEVNESEIARLKVDQLRDRLRRRGITGTTGMRKDELVDALVTALREGRKTTRSRNGSGATSRNGSGSRANSRSGRADGAHGGSSRSAGGSRGGSGGGSRGGSAGGSRGGADRGRGDDTGRRPGNQTPNTPEVNESEIARLKVDQLRDRLRRRGITGTTGMRKDELVDALVTALREGRRTTRSRAGSTSRGGSDTRGPRSAPVQETDLAEVERRAAELADVEPQAPEVEAVERRVAELEEAGADSSSRPRPGSDAATAATPRAELESTAARPALPAAPADSAAGSSGADASGAGPAGDRRVPGQRAGEETARTEGQPVRTPAAGGPRVSMETADRVLTSMVPPESGEVDEVVTPEGTRISTDPVTGSVATPPLPAVTEHERDAEAR